MDADTLSLMIERAREHLAAVAARTAPGPVVDISLGTPVAP